MVVTSVVVTSPELTVSSQIRPVAWGGQVSRGLLHQLRQRQRVWHQTLGIRPGIHLWEVLQGGSRAPKVGLKGDSRDSRRQWASGKYMQQRIVTARFSVPGAQAFGGEEIVQAHSPGQ